MRGLGLVEVHLATEQRLAMRRCEICELPEHGHVDPRLEHDKHCRQRRPSSAISIAN